MKRLVDEKKQDDMRRSFANPKLRFYIGDVRNQSSLKDALRGVDFVFQAAALKQVPSCEFFPLEALRTNALGTENMLNKTPLKFNVFIKAMEYGSNPESV